jgi:hypothetical protein
MGEYTNKLQLQPFQTTYIDQRVPTSMQQDSQTYYLHYDY